MQPNDHPLKAGTYVMTRPISEQDIRVLTADIVSYAVMGNKVPDMLANKVKVEQYLRTMFKTLPESVMTYVYDQYKASKAQATAGQSWHSYYYYGANYKNGYPEGCLPHFILLEDPKNPNGNPIEYPIKCVEEFFSF